MTEKQFTSFLAKIEQLPIPVLEKETVRLYQIYLKRCALGTERLVEDKIKLCLNERKRRLNRDFVFTPEVVTRIATINAKLTTATKTLLDKTTALNLQMQQTLLLSDGFLHDYSIEATLKMDWQTDDTMTEILDEFPGYNSLRTFQTNSADNADSIADNLDEFHWNEEDLSVPELSAISHFCYASHVLFCHLFYAYSDILHIAGFRNIVNVSWGNNQKTE